MEDQYGMADLRQYISSRPLFPQPQELISSHRPSHPYDMLIFRSDSTTSVTTNAGGGAASSSAAAGGCFSGFESGLNGGSGGGDGGAGRWPRQETLSLLEIRSRLDPRFKEANQKGPLWDEVSRIMYEENGYQRSGKKCREKFENLYKYYKKTKEGKAGRQDGKHYRFFRQLEALYGEPNNLHPNFHNPNTTLPTSIPDPSDTSLSLSNYSDADSISSDDTESEKTKKRGSKIRWKVKIKEFIDVQMKKLMDKQEAWMENMMTMIEHKERERIMREEEWRREDAERVEREQKFWAREREWIEARDAALMEALHKLTAIENQNDDGRTAMEMKLQPRGATEEGMWEDKWESVNNCVLKCNKKRKENYFESNPSQGRSVYGDTSEPVGDDSIIRSVNDNGNSPPRNNTGNAMSESCFRYFMGDGYGRIMH